MPRLTAVPEPPHNRRLLIRADAGRSQGSGHVMRSLAVAEAVRDVGCEVALAADLSALGWLRPWVDALGLQVVPDVPGPVELAALARGLDADIVLLDHYGFASARDQVNAAGAMLVNFEDDTYGRRPADIVIDYSLGAEKIPRPDDSSGQLLRGIAFAPLRQQVRAARQARAGRTVGRVHEVAVLMGGTDPQSLRPIVSHILAELGVVAMTAPPGLGLLDHITQADAVITAAGSTAYEMCCLGMPIGLVQVADNQSVNVQRLLGAGAATVLGTADELVTEQSGVTQRVGSWLFDHARLARTAETARGLLDGRGAERIADAILAPHASRRDVIVR